MKQWVTRNSAAQLINSGLVVHNLHDDLPSLKNFPVSLSSRNLKSI